MVVFREAMGQDKEGCESDLENECREDLITIPKSVPPPPIFIEDSHGYLDTYAHPC